jgi:hypothetical protein
MVFRMTPANSHTVSCHCGRIKFEVAAELRKVRDCNCSICSRAGYLHWYVEPAQVKLLTERQSMTSYVWRSLNGFHCFCPVCGVAVLRSMVALTQTRRFSVNARCVEGIDLTSLEIERYDGKNLLP